MTRILVVADIPNLRAEVASILAEPDVEVEELASGRDVRDFVADDPPDLLVIDSQIGSMGAFAVAQDLHLEAGAGRCEHVPVLILLDRRADCWLAHQSAVEGFLMKPIDPIRLRMALHELLAGRTWYDTTYAPATPSVVLPEPGPGPGEAVVAGTAASR